ncbi:hypothetical protein C8R43DRAFT_942175 [Mycena crocata]|nr:hypothetical protein C8R43DRAFT_942175 [Mycena crocata]
MVGEREYFTDLAMTGIAFVTPNSLISGLPHTWLATPPPRNPQEELEAQDRRLIEAIYSARYHRKNREERNRKTRLRMAALRAQDATLPPEQLATRLEARRASARKYREQNKWKIAKRAREARRLAKEQQQAEPCQIPVALPLSRRHEMGPGQRQDWTAIWQQHAADQAEWELRDRLRRFQICKVAARVYHQFVESSSPPAQDDEGYNSSSSHGTDRDDSDLEDEADVTVSRQVQLIRRMAEEEHRRRECIRRTHVIGYVTPEEFNEMLAMYLDDDLELHMGYGWLQSSWVHTFLHVLKLVLFLDYRRRVAWSLPAPTPLPAFARHFPLWHDVFIAVRE